MKRKKLPQKAIRPASAIAAGFALVAASAHAQTPVFNYTFPSSWGGTGTSVVDQSAAGHNGTTVGTLSLAAPFRPGGTSTQSLNTSAGAVITSGTGLLKNSAIAAAGGFNYHVDFMWSGTDSTAFSHTQKLVDYAGTESLQLVTTAGGTATLEMVFGNNTGVETVVASTTINSGTWYNVSMAFSTGGNPIDGTGALSGNVDLNVNGTDFTGLATKGTYGDSLNRQIGIGQLGAGFGYLVGFKGDIGDVSVSLAPEPSTLALGLVGGLGVLGTMWRRRKS